MKTILVADDVAEVRNFLAAILSRAHYAVVTAGTLVEAQHVCQEQKVAMVVLDDLDRGGAEWAVQLHSSGVPTLYTGAFIAAPDVPSLTKPIAMGDLLARVRGMIGEPLIRE